MAGNDGAQERRPLAHPAGQLPRPRPVSYTHLDVYKRQVQASNVRISNSGLSAVRIDADNVNFFGENVSLENWHGNAGFYIASASSFAHLGVGCTPGDAPYAPRSQFRRPQLA